ncbi:MULTISPECIES: mechanosensitive ion channel family protein [Halorussus]|uniref:mechanosensitive ion channel family protein n=1 Tax=Halorussus TaxID=1070314 RepID=UPI000E2141DB|nr:MULTISPECIES: mechanosensitive ion channel family protein [Halorussus]NHN58135.1 mechanosensitive ion channel family protein [Halorussus sp. JP-T4]
MVEPLPIIDSFLPTAYALAVTQALYFVVAFLAVYLIGRATVIPLAGRFLDRRNVDTHAKKPLVRIVRFGVVFVAVSVAFGFADYGNFLTSLATIAAAATLAIGLATQDVIKNFVAGVFIYTDKPFKIGDWIEWDNDTYAGIVEDIGLRVTRVRTFDNELLTVPNSSLTDGVIKNPVEADRLRLKFLFGIGYDDDIDRATEIIVEEAETHPDILDDPAPSVRLTELGDSSVGLQSRIWIADPSRSDYVKTKGEYVTSVKERFDEEGIDIPYPNRTLGGGLELANVEAVSATADD